MSWPEPRSGGRRMTRESASPRRGEPPRQRHGHGGRHPAPPGLVDRHREQLPHGRVAVGEDVALSGPARVRTRRAGPRRRRRRGRASSRRAGRPAGGGGSRRERPGRAPCPATAPGRRPRTGSRSRPRCRRSPRRARAPRRAAWSARRRSPSGSRRRPPPTPCRPGRRGRRRRSRCGRRGPPRPARAAAITLRGSLGVDPLEDARVGEPLLEQPHAVEDAVGALGRPAQGVRVGDVAAGELDPGRQQLACLGDVSDQRDDVVAAVGQPAGDRVADLARRSGDQESHGSLRVRARPGTRSPRHALPLSLPRAHGRPAYPVHRLARMARFRDPPDPLFVRLNASIGFDRRLGAVRHRAVEGPRPGPARGRGARRRRAASGSRTGSTTVAAELEGGSFPVEDGDEDIHMAIERRLTEIVGPARRQAPHRPLAQRPGGDRRRPLRARPRASGRGELVGALMARLLELAERHADWPMPGYTHLQRAQPVYLGHHLLAYFWMLGRDANRFDSVREARRRAAARLRRARRRQLGPRSRARSPVSSASTRSSPNSIDAVSNRDFVLDYLSAAAICATHLSRLGAEIVLWSSRGVRLLRGRPRTSPRARASCRRRRTPTRPSSCAPRRRGSPSGFLTLVGVMHGLPLAYSKDLQEDKEALFDAVDTLELCLEAAERMLGGPELRPRAARRGGRATRSWRRPTSPTCWSARGCRSGRPTAWSAAWSARRWSRASRSPS